MADQRAAAGLWWVNSISIIVIDVERGGRRACAAVVMLLQGPCLSGLLPLSQGVDVMSFLPVS